jgi:hypothetical protein
MVAPAVSTTFPTVGHPESERTRRHGPSAIRPSPAASIQVPKAVYPNISGPGRVTNGTDDIGRRRSGYPIRHISTAASHQRGRCQKNSRKSRGFHRNLVSSMKHRAQRSGPRLFLAWASAPALCALHPLGPRHDAIGCDGERSITLRPVHLLRNRDGNTRAADHLRNGRTAAHGNVHRIAG